MKVEWRTCFRICISVFLLYLCIRFWSVAEGFLSALGAALMPLLLGLVIAYVLNILMSFYEKHYFTRQMYRPWVKKSCPVVCLLGAIVTLLAIIALVVGLVVPELISCVKLLINEVEPAFDKLLQSERIAQIVPADILDMLGSLDLASVMDKAVKVLANGLSSAAGAVFNTVYSLISSLVNLLLSIIFAIYLLLDRDHLQRQCRRLMKCYLPTAFRQRLLHWLSVFNDCFRRFIVGQCVEAVILGVLCILGMTIFRFPYAMMIGTLIGFTALIPIAGAYIGAGVGALMILTQSPLKALLFLLFIVVLQQLEGNLIYPRVVGNSIGLPALWVLAAITVGGSLMGITGMLIGVPIAAALYRLLREDVRRRERV